jgi:hypothetical protein
MSYLKSCFFISTFGSLYFRQPVILGTVLLIFYKEKVEIGVSFVALLLFIKYNQT